MSIWFKEYMKSRMPDMRAEYQKKVATWDPEVVKSLEESWNNLMQQAPIAAADTTKQWKRSDISDFVVCLAYYKSDQFFHQEGNKKSTNALDILMDMTGAPEKVAWAAMQRTHNKDYVDYGTNLSVGWLTDAGKKFLGLCN